MHRSLRSSSPFCHALNDSILGLLSIYKVGIWGTFWYVNRLAQQLVEVLIATQVGALHRY